MKHFGGWFSLGQWHILVDSAFVDCFFRFFLGE